MPLFRKKRDEPARKKSAFRETVDVVLWALVMALFFRSFFIQAFRIPSGSMEDTLLIGDFLFVNKVLYGAQVPFTDWRLPGLRGPEPGEILVFRPPGIKEDYIKRCVAVGGQEVELKNGVLYRDGKVVEEDYVKLAGRHALAPRNFGPVTVPEGHLFMMGDNRDNSSDSRVAFGQPRHRGDPDFMFVDWRENVVGKALFIYWSWNSKKLFPRFDRIGDLIH